MEWADVTPYSRNGDRTPTAWEATAGDVRLIVVSEHIHNRGKWSFRIHPFMRDTEHTEMDAGVVSLDEIKQIVIETARKILSRSLDSLS